jgi:predicted Zn-dependent peptidase
VAGVADEVGGNIGTTWNQDYTEVRTVTTIDMFDDAVSLLGDILNNANFESKWVELARQEILTQLNTEGDDIFQTTYKQMVRKLYRDNPYNRPSLGYVRTIKSITPQDLLAFYEKYYVPNNMLISIAGDIDSEHALDRIRIAFAGTSAKTLPKTRP